MFGGPDATPAPAGGTFGNLWDIGGTIALDDSGRVMVFISVEDGPDGLYLYDGSWRAAALEGQTRVGDGTIEWVEYFRVAGNRFYAVFGLVGGGRVLAEYDGGGWTALVQNGDLMPNGSEINWIHGNFDVNRRGDLAFSANVNGGSVLALRTSDGTLRTVCRSGAPTEDGDYFWPWRDFKLDLQGDGSLYFIGVDLTDRSVLYHAQPVF